MALHRKPIEVSAWLLTDHDGKTAQQWLFEAIATLTAQGWRGTPLLGPSGSIDRAEFNGADPLGSVFATFGNWLVLDGTLRVLTPEQVIEEYDVVEDGE